MKKQFLFALLSLQLAFFAASAQYGQNYTITYTTSSSVVPMDWGADVTVYFNVVEHTPCTLWGSGLNMEVRIDYDFRFYLEDGTGNQCQVYTDSWQHLVEKAQYHLEGGYKFNRTFNFTLPSAAYALLVPGNILLKCELRISNYQYTTGMVTCMHPPQFTCPDEFCVANSGGGLTMGRATFISCIDQFVNTSTVLGLLPPTFFRLGLYCSDPHTRIKASWVPSPNATGYEITNCLTGQTVSVPGGFIGEHILSANPGTTYQYKIRAVYNNTVTAYSPCMIWSTLPRELDIYPPCTPITRKGRTVDESLQAALINEVYPNPASSSCRVSYQVPEGAEAVLVATNVMGQVLFRKPLNSSETEITLDVSGMSDGVCFLNLLINGASSSIKKMIIAGE